MKELALNILDIAQNSIKADASEIKLFLTDSEKSNKLIIEIIDNGSGIDEEMLKTIDDPYTTSRQTRNVGMGIPLLKYHSEITGGKIKIESKESEGTRIKAVFIKDHIDRQPLGDLAGVIRILLSADSKLNFCFQYGTDNGKFSISTDEIKNELGLSDLNDNKLLGQINELIYMNLKEMGSEIK